MNNFQEVGGGGGGLVSHTFPFSSFGDELELLSSDNVLKHFLPYWRAL